MTPREIRSVYVPPDRYFKLATKGITITEVEEAIRNATRVYRGPKNASPDQQGACYFIEERTDAGRLLKILVRRYDGGAARLITAWEPE